MTGRRDRIQRFEVVAELGSGGMGTVHHARDPRLQRDVAIKVLALRGAPPPELSSVRTVDLRTPAAATHDDLLAEARVMAQVSHPNVLPVYEVGLDGDAMFLVMELVEGSNLRTWLHGRPARAEVERVFADAARGLAAAHARGVVHRDFKPDNVLIGTDGRVRVADFGLSQLGRGSDPLIEWGDLAGTPDYMAPEQWRGGVATPRSDVYAFARALAEALTGVRGETAELDERLAAAGVDGQLRALLRAGVDDEPEARPTLAQFIAALEGRARPRPRRLPIVAAAVAGAAVLAAAGYAMLHQDDVAACEAATGASGSPWDAPRRAALVRAVGEEPAALVDRRLGELAAGRHAACSARAAGETTATETAMWLSCIDRRIAELGAVVRNALTAVPPDPRRTGDLVFAIVDDCRGHTDPPLPADPAPALALLDRFTLVPGLPRPQQLAAQQAIQRAAAALGERELEARSTFSVARNLRDTDKFKDALTAYERSHRIATEIHATNIAVSALVDNANISASHGDSAGANRLVALARELIDRPEVTAWNRARVWLAIGRVQGVQGDYAEALASFERGRTLIVQSGRPLVQAEISMRIDKMNALVSLLDRRAEAVAFGRETVDYVQQTDGENQGLAIALEYYAAALANASRLAEAIAASRRALAIYLKRLPATHSSVIDTQITLAGQIRQTGRYTEARDMYRAAYAAAEGNEMLRNRRDTLLRGMAITEFNLGNYDEAMRLFQDAVDEAVAAHGKDHLNTLLALEQYARYALEAGRLDDATRRFSAVLAGYHRRPDTTPLVFARLEGDIGVSIALAHVQPRDAEALARKSLAVLRADPGAAAEDRTVVEDRLAGALIEQRRWREALEAAEAALADARASDLRADRIAITQLKQARALYELGHRVEGRELARAARAVLAGSPGERRANQQAAALVAKLR